MISDEMRELLSTYVDGELRDADAVRVEEWAKRDPELRREVEAYRILRKQLKEWDAVEHGDPPSPQMRETALSRAQAYLAATREQSRGRIVQLLEHPALMAAALLLAVGAGLLLADSGDTGVQRVATVGPGEPVAIADHAPIGTLALEGHATISLGDIEPYAPPEGTTLFDSIQNHSGGYLVDGVVMSGKAIQLRKEWEALERREKRLTVKGEEVRPERRSDARSPEILAMLGSYEALKAPYGGLVLLTHPEPERPPGAAAIPAGAAVGYDYDLTDDFVFIDTSRTGVDQPTLVLSGEVLRGVKDGSGRTRVTRTSAWIQPRESEAVAITWTDGIESPSNMKWLSMQPVMLGPEARRRLVKARTRDPEFLKWLRETYNAHSLVEAFRDPGRERTVAVNRLLKQLRQSRGATGFAVLAEGKVLGVELFATHELMLEFAPRLLHGYMVEAGTQAVSLEAPARRGLDLVRRAQKLVDDTPSRALKLEDSEKSTFESLEETPQAGRVRCVNLRTPLGKTLGHGLLYDGRPLHLHLFGE
ncbi:MAG: ARPP-1 family domain-containing protein [Planctomycetota bacterium]|jgi:hypothetical protein